MGRTWNMNLIYLDKRSEDQDTSKWAYYRLKGDTEDCANGDTALVSFPDFKDTVPVMTIGPNIGRDALYDDMNTMLKWTWGIDRERSILIGIIEHEVKLEAKASPPRSIP
jgi:hypothetical protein